MGRMKKELNGQPELEAYLDIETTGLYPGYSQITVVGIYLSGETQDRCVQLVGDKINGDSILESLEGVTSLYTYNGSRFDLPFIKACHKVDLITMFDHCDLMFHCWRNRLYGGLKKVETCLGIERQTKGVDGYLAVKLWWQYINNYDQAALKTLLDYNKEDVVNLKTLKERLLKPPI
jgi:uncharacterized protein YprB with RNaseH-like and TPR domain